MVLIRSKVAIVGDAAVGKTSLVTMFQNGSAAAAKNYMMTQSMSSCVKTISIPETDVSVELHLYDIAGSPIFEKFVDSHIENISSFLIVYDATNEESFRNCNKWQTICKRARPGKPLVGAVLANKMDLEDRITVPSGQGQSWARSAGLSFFQASALAGQDVDVPFMFLASEIYEKYRAAHDAAAATMK